MIEARTKFNKGINRRFPIEDADEPNRFYTLQNARLFKRGDTGIVNRIDGYEQFNVTSEDYTNILDLITFQDHIVVLFRDAVSSTTFQVDVLDLNGNRVFTDTYTGDTTTEGKLVGYENNVYVSPHPKILHYDGSSWYLKDYISKIPTITSISVTDGSTKGSGSIQVESAVQAGSGSSATGILTILRNNTPPKQSDTFTVDIDGTTTSNITVEYGDTVSDISERIYNALVSGTPPTSINPDWNVFHDGNEVRFESVATGSTWNKENAISINNSDFNITKKGDKVPSLFQDENDDGVNDFDNQTKTIDIQQPIGGADTNVEPGPVNIQLIDQDISIITENLTTSDTLANIATKIYNALSGSSEVTDKYTVTQTTTSVTNDTIQLDAIDAGYEYNSQILLSMDAAKNFSDSNKPVVTTGYLFDATISNITGGEDANINSSLEPETYYWYKCQYKFNDGHRSNFCEPKVIKTKQRTNINLTVQTPELNLDDSRPKLEIYRKEDGDNFYLVEVIDVSSDTTNFTDSGELEKNADSETNNIWFKEAKTQEIVNNRLVKSNIDYFDETYSWGTAFNITTTPSTDDISIPKNTNVDVYVRPRYEDGTVGYHQKIGSENVRNSGEKIQITQNDTLTNSDKTIDEISYLFNYVNQTSKDGFTFNCAEVANRNIETIEDRNIFPNRTRLLFGFKYFIITKNEAFVPVGDWNSDDAQVDINLAKINRPEMTSGVHNSEYPLKIQKSFFGITFQYVLYAFRNTADDTTAIYKLDNIEALKQAVSTGDLKIKMSQNPKVNLSSTEDNETLFNKEVNVVNVIDKSEEHRDVEVTSDDIDETFKKFALLPTKDARIYLELEESIYDEIDNTSLNNYSYKAPYKPTLGGVEGFDLEFNFKKNEFDDYSLKFKFINFEEIQDSTQNTYSGDGNSFSGGRPINQVDGQYYFYEWDYKKFELTRSVRELEEPLILVHTKDNSTDAGVTIDQTGFTLSDKEFIKYHKLSTYNLYESLILERDVNLEKTSYPNQLIWTNEIDTGSEQGSGRNFSTEAFLNISDENGNIKNIVSLNNRLYAFCETGVSQINVGEVLTQQKGGEVFVNTADFLTDYFWILEDINIITPYNVVKYENQIYLTDGFDVYSLSSQGIQSINNGAVLLDQSNTYNLSIDSEFDELRVSDETNGQTWIYNFLIGEWYGPHTYDCKGSTNYNNRSFSVVANDLIEFNKTNTFDGVSFTTKIESVGNDTKKKFLDKNFRKFYFNSENDTGSTFYYGKDYNSMTSKSFANISAKNGFNYVGVAPTEGNTKQIFWRIETTQDDFKLKDFVTLFSEHIRR